MPIVPDPPISAYAPHFRAGTVTIVCETVDREPVFGQVATADLLRAVLRDVRTRWPFHLLGWTILPHRVHLLLCPRPGIQPLAIVRRMRRDYEEACSQLIGAPGALVVWAPGIGLQRVRDLPEFARTLDRIHYAAVAAGLVAHPEDWPHSSYASWVERRLYKLGWGWTRPARLRAEPPGRGTGSPGAA